MRRFPPDCGIGLSCFVDSMIRALYWLSQARGSVRSKEWIDYYYGGFTGYAEDYWPAQVRYAQRRYREICKALQERGADPWHSWSYLDRKSPGGWTIWVRDDRALECGDPLFAAESRQLSFAGL